MVIVTGNAANVVVRQAAESVPLGEEAQITLDTSAAGRGACTCHIRQPNGAEADLDIEDNADGTVSIFYTPRIPGTYSVEIKFGGVVIPQSPLQQRVRLILTPSPTLPPTLLLSTLVHSHSHSHSLSSLQLSRKREMKTILDEYVTTYT